MTLNGAARKESITRRPNICLLIDSKQSSEEWCSPRAFTATQLYLNGAGLGARPRRLFHAGSTFTITNVALTGAGGQAHHVTFHHARSRLVSQYTTATV